MDSPSGVLALWNDCAPGEEAFYEHWYQTEHLPERLSIDGFIRGRRYEAVAGSPKFFTYYETQSPSVLTSPGYYERLNDPTPATQRVMNGIFKNMSRTVCECITRVGSMRGSAVVTVKLATLDSSVNALANKLVVDSDITLRSEVWQAIVEPKREPTAEEKIRGGDVTISACLIVETVREHDAITLANALEEELGDNALEIGVYRFLCERVS